MILRHLVIALVGTGALALAGCGSKQVPDVVGMNPQEAIEAMHAADLNTDSHGGLGLEEGTGFVVCETKPKAGEATGGDVEIYSRRGCKPKTSTAEADVKQASDKARDGDGDSDDDEVVAQQSSKSSRSPTASIRRARDASSGSGADSGCTRQKRAVVEDVPLVVELRDGGP